MDISLLNLPILQKAHRWIIAYSGGVDSHVLLKLATEAAKDSKKILALHIHHGLSPFADDWLIHCQTITQNLSIEFKAIKVDLSHRQGESLEAYAREARYAALTEYVSETDVLLTGHHADDQAETFLLQLFRGAGIKGLAAMPMAKSFGKGYLIRPFLSIRRQAIIEYAEKLHLSWIQDESNQNLHFDRNFVRQEVIPLLQSRWPALQTVLNRSAQHMADADTLLMDQGRLFYQKAQSNLKSLNLAYLRTGIISRLSIESLLDLSPIELNNALRTWLYDLKILLPSTKNLSRLQSELLSSRSDAQALVSWDNYELRRFEGEIYLSSILEHFDPQSCYSWDLKTDLELPIGTLNLDLVKNLNLPINSKVEIRFRQGGERFHPKDRAHSQTLKKLFQEWHIPPWLRDRVPLFYVNNELRAVLTYTAPT